MKIFLSIALAAASIVSTAALAPASIMAQAAQAATQPAPVQATAVALDTKLDTRTAKAGDVFTVRLLEDATVGGTKFPIGSHLLGKITNASPGTLVLLFDSIQVKKADPVPAHASLAAIAKEYDANATGMGTSDGVNGLPSKGASTDPLVMTALGSSIKGITLTTGKTTETSGTISSPKDFKLDKGTRMWVGLF